ncbi:uncharacterized protein LOC128676804 [Plodia interpunctella]|nr:uncharacterized protein LOC128676804 [Plodia interpunctella]
MGKRTKDKTNEEIERKIRRLERELYSRKTWTPTPNFLPNEDRDDSSYNFRGEVELDVYPFGDENETPESLHTVAEVHAKNTCLPPEVMAEDSQHIPDNAKSVLDSDMITEESVPEEIMQILGEAKKTEEIFGKKIPQGVSEKLGKILVEGLAKEQKEILLTQKLIIPENFQLVKAPKLNPEVASVLTDPAKNRDKRLEKLQNQLGLGIAGLVNLTTELINKEVDKMAIIKKISEVNQILLDLHYEETLGRRRLIIPMLDNKFINIIQSVKRDQFLFGDNLGDNIKTSKSIEKSSLQIKKPAPPQPPAN